MASSKSNKKEPVAPTEGTTRKKAAERASKPAKASSKGKGGKGDKPGFIARVRSYFKSVGVEVRRVVWPTKSEMVKYTGAVIGMLIFFGVLIAIVDAVVVPVLYAFSGLR